MVNTLRLPIQDQVIARINNSLGTQALPREGICNILTALWLLYSSMGQEEDFAAMLCGIADGSALTTEYYQELITALIKLKKAEATPSLRQTDLDNILKLFPNLGVSLVKETRFGFIYERGELAEILKKLDLSDRLLQIVSNKHAIGARVVDGRYCFYDPNGTRTIVETAEQLEELIVKYLYRNFSVDTAVFHVNIEVYRNSLSEPRQHPQLPELFSSLLSEQRMLTTFREHQQEEGRSTFRYLCLNGHADLLTAALALPQWSDKIDLQEEYFLMLRDAVKIGYPEVITILLDHPLEQTLGEEQIIDVINWCVAGADANCLELLLTKFGNKLLNTEHPEHEELALCEAVFYNNIACVQLLLAAGADPQKNTSRGKNPLTLACQNNNMDIAKLLIARGASVTPIAFQVACEKKQFPVLQTEIRSLRDKVSSDSFEHSLLTAMLIPNTEIRQGNFSAKTSDRAKIHYLQLACIFGHKTIAEKIVEAEPLLELQNAKRNSPLRLAIAYGQDDIVKILLEKDNNIDAEILNDICTNSSLDTLKFAVSKTPEAISPLLLLTALQLPSGERRVQTLAFIFNLGFELRKIKSLSHRALEIAIENKDLALLQICLDQGADIHAVDTITGESLLHLACKIGDVDIVDKLLQLGLDPNTQDVYGSTPLHFAAQKNHPAAVNALINAKANTELTDNKACTALHYAVDHGNYRVTEILLTAVQQIEGANPHATMTPLGLAVMNGDTPIAQLLLEHGANLKNCLYEGNEPLFKAVNNGHVDTVKRLLAAGIDPNTKNAEGQTVLHIACSKGLVHMAEVLSSHPQININIPDKKGRTPISIAVKNGYFDLAGTLLQSAPQHEIQSQLIMDIARGERRSVTQILNTLKTKRDKSKFGLENMVSKNNPTTGLNALHMACLQGDVPMVRLILEYGVDASVKDAAGNTALHLCAAAGNRDIFKVLYPYITPQLLNATNTHGKTALEIAIANENVGFVAELFKDPNLIFNNKHLAQITQLHNAEFSNHLREVNSKVVSQEMRDERSTLRKSLENAISNKWKHAFFTADRQHTQNFFKSLVTEKIETVDYAQGLQQVVRELYQQFYADKSSKRDPNLENALVYALELDKNPSYIRLAKMRAGTQRDQELQNLIDSTMSDRGYFKKPESELQQSIEDNIKKLIQYINKIETSIWYQWTPKVWHRFMDNDLNLARYVYKTLNNLEDEVSSKEKTLAEHTASEFKEIFKAKELELGRKNKQLEDIVEHIAAPAA